MKITNDQITKLAYLVEEAYRETENREQAINYLLEKNQLEADETLVVVFKFMWEAINAWIDVNTPITLERKTFMRWE